MILHYINTDSSTDPVAKSTEGKSIVSTDRTVKLWTWYPTQTNFNLILI